MDIHEAPLDDALDIIYLNLRKRVETEWGMNIDTNAPTEPAWCDYHDGTGEERPDVYGRNLQEAKTAHYAAMCDAESLRTVEQLDYHLIGIGTERRAA